MNSVFNITKIVKVIISLAIVASIASCAMIMHGTFQKVGITSNPSGAKVSIDNTDYGLTPVVAKLSRKAEHNIAINLEGYEPYEIKLTRTTSSWIYGNIIFGGLIGVAVDVISGSIYKLTPEQISPELKERISQGNIEDNDIYIIVSLNPKSDWQEIGKLQPAQ